MIMWKIKPPKNVSFLAIFLILLCWIIDSGEGNQLNFSTTSNTTRISVLKLSTVQSSPPSSHGNKASSTPTTKPTQSTSFISIEETKENSFTAVSTTKMPSNKALRFSNVSFGNTTEFSKIIGQSIELDCQVEGTPQSSIKWLKNNKAIELVSYRLLQREQKSLWKMQLNGLLLADSGTYTCHVTSKLASLTRSFILSVKERQEKIKPLIKLLMPNNISATTGTKVSMHCRSTTEYSDAVPYMRWEKKRKFLLNKNDSNNEINVSMNNKVYKEKDLRKKFGNSNYSIIQNNNSLEVMEVVKTERSFKSELVFEQVDLDDDAEYSCVAFNDVGYSKASQYMRVYPAPKPTRLQLAMIYAAKYGGDGSSFGLPLSVIVALPVCLVIIFVIGIVWWKENGKRPREQDPVTLLDIKKMREIDNFSSLEHMGNCSSRVDNKPFSSASDLHGDSAEVDEEEVYSEEHQESQRLLGNGNHLIQVINPKPKPNDEKNLEFIPMHAMGSPCSDTPNTCRSSAMGSHEELEWEPVDLKLNVSTSSKSHTSKGSDVSV